MKIDSIPRYLESHAFLKDLFNYIVYKYAARISECVHVSSLKYNEINRTMTGISYESRDKPRAICNLTMDTIDRDIKQAKSQDNQFSVTLLETNYICSFSEIAIDIKHKDNLSFDNEFFVSNFKINLDPSKLAEVRFTSENMKQGICFNSISNTSDFIDCEKLTIHVLVLPTALVDEIIKLSKTPFAKAFAN